MTDLTPLVCAVVDYGYVLPGVKLSGYTIISLIFFVLRQRIMTCLSSHMSLFIPDQLKREIYVVRI